MKLEKIYKESSAQKTTDCSTKGSADHIGTRLRVAAYCRVSTDLEEQQSSYEAQKNVYYYKITSNPEWEYAGIYADEGVTGTSVRKRENFQRMIQDCENGKIDFIITKSISRFARNTLECLTYVRKLQQLGVQLLFEKENINTGHAYSEILLTVLAAFAQEESHSISENITWGIRKRFEEGISRWKRLYGYTADSHNTYCVVEKEAKVVQMIFDLYEHGYSMAQIRNILVDAGIPSPTGKANWEPSSVMTILRNEKYAGDILLQKTYTEDHISHHVIRNTMTKVPGYYIRDHHKAIIDRKTFERVQKIRELNCQGGGNGQKGKSIQYPFSTMLVCPYCGSRLIQRKLPIQDGSRGWCCDSCRKFVLKNRVIEAAVLRAWDAAESHAMEEKLRNEKDGIAFLELKEQHPSFERVDYYWLDETIDRIEFGRHMEEGNGGDWTITVYWKCGFATTVPSGVEKKKDMPSRIVELYNSYLERQKRGYKE